MTFYRFIDKSEKKYPHYRDNDIISSMQVHTLDLFMHSLPQVTAVFLLVGPEGPVLIETGPGSSLQTVLNHLGAFKISPQHIKHVLVTHIHLDHAGAAGWWAQQGAQVYVHPRGAPHLIDPSKLIASAYRIYGDKLEKMWGNILPAPERQITIIEGGTRFKVAGLSFEALDTPGHARHHHVYKLGDIAFVGDAGGIHMPHNPVPGIPAPPPEFELDAWQKTLDRLLKANFKTIYLTHFGRVDHVQEHLMEIKKLLNDAVQFISYHMGAGASRDAIVAHYEEWNRQRAHAAGISDAMIQQHKAANPLYMSVDGIMRYCRKQGLVSP